MQQFFLMAKTMVLSYGFKILAALAIFLIGRMVAKTVCGVVGKQLKTRLNDETMVSFVMSVAYAICMILVVIASLGHLGVQTASLIAVLGAAGFAVGLALQGSLANFAAGVLLIIFKPFKIGDYIEAGGTAGTVEEIGVFATILKSPDNKKIIVPNGKMNNDNIVNYSAKSERRVDMVASVSYSDDLDKVRKVLEEILAEDDRILEEPAPKIAVQALADSSVNFVVRPWVKSADYWNVFFDTQEKIKKRFDKEGITIPFPHRQVYVRKEE
jgi:small conductance mechanosensitive channel